MCIFSQPVTSVNNTQIFARTTAVGTQFLAYRMNYESRYENAMILPLPVRRPATESTLQFIDLSAYDGFFEDLASGFPHVAPTFNIGCSAALDKSAGSLDVFEVGNYIASFIPTISDFARLDERFTLPKATWSEIPAYASYGFAVFQLAAGALKPHPMAFEFETGDDSIYFPTLHIHDGQVHATEEFDHVLYLQHAGFDSRVHAYQNFDVADKSTRLIRSKHAAKHFCDIDRCRGLVDGNLLVHRKFVRGMNANKDTTILTFGDPVRPSLNLRPLLRFTPWLVVSAWLVWFLARRARVKSIKTT